MSFFFHSKPDWQLPESHVTSETSYYNRPKTFRGGNSRRQFLKSLIGAGFGVSALTLTGCQQSDQVSSELKATYQKLPQFKGLSTNPNFIKRDRPITDQVLASSYNNFYEFGGSKSIWQSAQNLPLKDWEIEVTGLVKNPRTYDPDTLKKEFPIEERIYRFRCVEAWSMVLPWVGFPMKALIETVEPTSKAKYVKFTSFYDADITKGPGFHFGSLPWPYTEGLTLEEMANDLAFFAIGIYGRELPKQHGAPLRMVVPWKYGFKGAKSIVKIEFVEKQPATYWNTLIPNEYGFQANVNPNVPHPRWSQATERFISAGPNLSWEVKETFLYNGYEEYVGELYS